MNSIDLVTGATGFIGRALVKALVSSGRGVRCLVRAGSDASRLTGAEIVRGDLLDRRSLDSAAKGAARVWHLGALVRPKGPLVPRGALLKRFFDVNAGGTGALAEAAAAAGAERFIYFSSISALGPGENLSDDAGPSPLTAYGRAKQQGEAALKEVSARSGLPHIILRPAMVFGPGSPGWVSFVRGAARSLVPVPGQARNNFSVCHLDDLVPAALLAAEKGTPGTAFNISARSLPLKDLLLAAAAVQGRRPAFLPLPPGFLKASSALLEGLLAGVGLYMPGFIGADAGRLAEACAGWSHSCEGLRALGWRPRVKLDEGLASVLEAHDRA